MMKSDEKGRYGLLEGGREDEKGWIMERDEKWRELKEKDGRGE